MNFQKEIEIFWKKHASDPEYVVGKLPALVTMTESLTDLQKIIGFLVHFYSEHVEDLPKALEYIEILKQISNKIESSHNILKRAESTLKFCYNSEQDISDLSKSDQVYILATLASVKANKKKYEESEIHLRMASDLIEAHMPEDSSVRTLAIANNNLACAMDEIISLDANQTARMIAAAKDARKYWEIAGTWLEVERAEYRLAKSYLKARDFILSIKHANLCLTLCEKNSAEPLEFFFAYESIAAIEKAMKQPLRSLTKMKEFYSLLKQADQAWCRTAIDKIESV